MNANGPGGVKAEKDIVFGRGGDTELRLDILRPPAGSEKRTAVVHVFGGGYTRGSKEDGYLTRNAQRLAERGYVCVASAYRHAPGAKWPAQIHDLKAAIRWTRANAGYLGVDADKIAIAGYSAGGQLALVCAGTAGMAELEGDGGSAGVSSAVAACLSYYPARVWRGDEGPSSAIMPDDASDGDYAATDPLTYAAPGFPPTIIFNGTADPFIEPNTRLYEALQQAGVPAELHLYAGMPHVFDLHPGFGESTSELCDLFLDRYVANPRVYEGFPRRQQAARASGGGEERPARLGQHRERRGLRQRRRPGAERRRLPPASGAEQGHGRHSCLRRGVRAGQPRAGGRRRPQVRRAR